MGRPILREEDLRESFVRSQGPGGQNVNKVASCVILYHVPTGITVRCEEERSQARNRLLARQRLAERLEALVRKEEHARLAALAKARKQRWRRPKALQKRVIEDKRKLSKKKQVRRPLRPGDSE